MSELGQLLIKHVRDLAAQHPKQFAECQYQSDGKPVCIVGHALDAVGLLHITSPDRAGYTKARTIRSLSDTEPELATLTDDEIDWLQWVQYDQDGGDSWGRAVGSADWTFPRGH